MIAKVLESAFKQLILIVTIIVIAYFMKSQFNKINTTVNSTFSSFDTVLSSISNSNW